ncbi:YqgQ family protein [Oceanobacillus sp. FSL H7-0719]|uniref:YqgQ family protein n=1 Tax=Oceanobacillus sp. FSL H7-0719 TaxID=2954507 RepID=UPI003255239F
MHTVYDVRMLLKRFGTFIYSGDRIGDLILMDGELNDLYNMQFITNKEYTTGKVILLQEKNRLELKKEEGL